MVELIETILVGGLAFFVAILLRDALQYTVDTFFPEDELKEELREHGIKKKTHLKLIFKWTLFVVVCLVVYVIMVIIDFIR